MKLSHCPLKLWIGPLLLGLLVGSNGITHSAAQAQFKSPPGQGRPKGTAGGGSRPGNSLCLAKSADQTALNEQDTLIAMAPLTTTGLTTQTSPTVWVYVPSNTTAKVLEFSLYDQQQQGVYQMNVPVKQSGLLQISLSGTAITLKPGQPYHWTAALVCDPIQRSQDWIVDGWIQQQPLPTDLQSELRQATVDQRVSLYLKAGYWYEALDAYVALQKQQPNHANLILLWNDLLKSAGLKTLAPPS